MTTEDVLKINTDRLGMWAKDLTAVHATPFLVIGVGHDEHAGEIRIVTLEDVDLVLLTGFIRMALKLMEKKSNEEKISPAQRPQRSPAFKTNGTLH